ncbi:uncharacterized protein LOC109800568 [Cajanus cajan]|uniref:Uncharacterized protein n=1 Tax=Cajanus cajan TaxID=3821 RepID=A0A151TJW3_CAJCA|nr:uncharacterized protein LOC109800568 [Cajanus cajan]KYP67344.1 hypothetical protein KK1_013672 [Cajanus cajan]
MAPNFLFLLKESKRIIKTRSRHFSILFLIFLLPLSVFFQILIFYSNISQTQQQQQKQKTINPLFYVLYFVFVLVFYTCALSSITYSVYHFFYGRPVKLLPSIFSSFLPLLVTMLLSFPCSFSLALLIILGFGIVDVTSLGFFVVLPLVPVVVVMYLKVNWTLVPVIVAVESRWGLEPFRRSERLMKGMKVVALSHLLISGFWVGILVRICSNLMKGVYGICHGSWANGTVIGASSCLVATFLLNDIAVSTVLYIYCRANHGEQFGKNYVRLISPDGDVEKENCGKRKCR